MAARYPGRVQVPIGGTCGIVGAPAHFLMYSFQNKFSRRNGKDSSNVVHIYLLFLSIFYVFSSVALLVKTKRRSTSTSAHYCVPGTGYI